MPNRISDIFLVEPALLRNHKVFNGFIEIDSKFYVDPRLLTKTSVYELRNSSAKVTDYFNDVLNDVLNCIQYQKGFDAIHEKLIFSEIPLAGLGYSINHTGGKGIGQKLASNLSQTIVEIGQQGILDPIIFELAGLFEEGIGADRISDMIIHILLPELAEFSSRVAQSLNLPISHSTKIGNQSFPRLPCYKDQGILLVPEDILTALPVAYSWTNIESITAHNAELREYVNKMIKKEWSYLPTVKELIKNKKTFKNLILEKPELIQELINKYKSKFGKPYDFKNDPNNEFKWHDITRDYAHKYPLTLKDLQDKSYEEFLNFICQYFSNLVQKGLCTEFYKDSGEPNLEKRGQLILLELLEHIIKQNFLSYNPHTGFIKLSITNFQSSIILKYTSTKRITEYYENLLEKSQGNSSYTIFLLVLINKGTKIIDEINEIERKYTGKISDRFKRFDIDGRITMLGRKKRPFTQRLVNQGYNCLN